MATLPESADYGINGAETVEYTTKTYLVKDGRICGMADGLEAMRQVIDIMLRTERYQYQIYTSNFGVEFQGLIGKVPEYVMSMVKRRVTEVLMTDKRTGYHRQARRVHHTDSLGAGELVFGRIVSGPGPSSEERLCRDSWRRGVRADM